MPRGKYVNHKGRSRHFTAPEELAQQTDSSEEEVSEEEEEGGATGGTANKKTRAKKKVVQPSSSESEEGSEEDVNAKKGVAGLIEIENPNHTVVKATVKLNNLSVKDGDAPVPKTVLWPSDKKAIAKQEKRKRYEKLHAEGKTTEAKSDLARLAIIRQQRAEAAAKREAEKKATEMRKAT